ncbi:SRPBCC domain-containing protein [Bacillus spongiae]|uniref:SRPBCC domain-containing protein n=1 Tax=Bacillus spongiae TaxID=2683610 RepID=A0ABU8HAP4_9BACI
MSTYSKEAVIERTATINAPLNLVWHAWTIADRVSQWFAAEARITPKVGGVYELYFERGNTNGMNTKGCTIVSMIHRQELTFTWKGPDQFRDFMNHGELTTVKVKLEELKENKTNVRLQHVGWRDGEGWDEALKWHEMAWSGVLNSLKSALEEGIGQLCCQPE